MPNSGQKTTPQSAKIPGMNGNENGNGVAERISAVERDQAVTNTRLNTLTDTVQTLVDGVNDIKTMLQNSRGGNGKVSWGTLATGVGVFLPSLSISVGLLYYVIQSEIRAEALIRRGNDIILEDRQRASRDLLRIIKPEFPPYPTTSLPGD